MEYIKLFFAITLPLALPISALACLFGSGSWRDARWKKCFTLRSEESLWRQPSFWLSILVPIGFFVSTGLIAWQGYSLKLSSEGLATFLSISTLPLGLLSAAIPLSVIVASFHSTEQTAKQIIITQHKNNIESFYSHRNELFNYFDRVGTVNYFGCFNAKNKVHPRMHKLFFKGTPNQGIPEIDKESFETIAADLITARWQIDIVLKTNDMDKLTSWYLLNACNSLHLLVTKLNLLEVYDDLADRSVTIPMLLDGESGWQKIRTFGNSTSDMVATYRYARAFFRNLCDFAGWDFTEKDKELYSYFETGGKYLTIKSSMNVEHIHHVEIPRLLEYAKMNYKP